MNEMKKIRKLKEVKIMNKKRMALGVAVSLIICIGLILPSAISEKDKTIKLALSPMEGEDVYPIPVGSTIVHLPNGTTEVYGPQKELILSVEDKDVEMIPTPSGFVKATHVHQVPSGTTIVTTGNTAKAYKVGVCLLTVINHCKSIADKGIDQTRNNNQPKILGRYSDGSGRWIEFATDDSKDTVDHYDGYWTVPSSPPNPDNNVINYLFISMQDNGIIQPVLEYTASGNWKIASWYGSGNDYYHSTKKPVDEGDLIHGIMNYEWAGHLWEWRWTITTTGNGYSTTIHTIDFDDKNMTEQVAFEAYYINGDGDVPGDTLFTNLNIKNNGQRVDVTWVPIVDPADAEYLDDLYVRMYSDYKVRLETAN